MIKVKDDRTERKRYINWLNSLKLESVDTIENLENQLSDGVILLKVAELLQSDLVDWKKVNIPAVNKFKKLTNCNYLLSLCKELNLPVGGIGGRDIMDFNHDLSFGLLFVLMRELFIKENGLRSNEEIIKYADQFIEDEQQQQFIDIEEDFVDELPYEILLFVGHEGEVFMGDYEMEQEIDCPRMGDNLNQLIQDPNINQLVPSGDLWQCIPRIRQGEKPIKRNLKESNDSPNTTEDEFPFSQFNSPPQEIKEEKQIILNPMTIDDNEDEEYITIEDHKEIMYNNAQKLVIADEEVYEQDIIVEGDNTSYNVAKGMGSDNLDEPLDLIIQNDLWNSLDLDADHLVLERISMTEVKKNPSITTLDAPDNFSNNQSPLPSESVLLPGTKLFDLFYQLTKLTENFTNLLAKLLKSYQFTEFRISESSPKSVPPYYLRLCTSLPSPLHPTFLKLNHAFQSSLSPSTKFTTSEALVSLPDKSPLLKPEMLSRLSKTKSLSLQFRRYLLTLSYTGPPQTDDCESKKPAQSSLNPRSRLLMRRIELGHTPQDLIFTKINPEQIPSNYLPEHWFLGDNKVKCLVYREVIKRRMEHPSPTAEKAGIIVSKFLQQKHMPVREEVTSESITTFVKRFFD